MLPLYPDASSARDKWILAQRKPRNSLDPQRPYAFFVEEECSHTGEIVPVATIFLTNRECPWRCVMCDLWQNTLIDPVPPGAIPEQLDYALARMVPTRQIKLYNSGSFFDPRAIPTQDHAAIAQRVAGFDRVIVESHPTLINENCIRLQDGLAGQLEVAMGLETVHPEVLPRLNKRMTLNQFSAAAALLRRSNIDLRVFVLVQPPFMKTGESLYWAERSLDFAFDCGATAVTLIPTRAGNGAMEALAAQGEFVAPALAVLEAAMNYGLSLRRGRVFSDVWALGSSPLCEACREPRISRLAGMNLKQCTANPVRCDVCGVRS